MADGAQAAVRFTNVEDGVVRNSKALPATAVFLEVTGEKTRAIRLFGNDLGAAQTPYRLGSGVKRDAVSRAAP